MNHLKGRWGAQPVFKWPKGHKVGKKFVIVFTVTATHYVITFNKKALAKFKHRVGLAGIKKITVSGSKKVSWFSIDLYRSGEH